MNTRTPELTRNLARAIISSVAKHTQHRDDIRVDVRQFNVDASTVLSIISLHDGQNQLTITTSTIREARRSTRGMVAATYRTGVNTEDEQYTQAMALAVDSDIIPHETLEQVAAVLDQWMNAPATSRRELAYA